MLKTRGSYTKSFDFTGMNEELLPYRHIFELEKLLIRALGNSNKLIDFPLFRCSIVFFNLMKSVLMLIYKY